MIPHDERRFENIKNKLAELEIVCSKNVDNIGFSSCSGYAEHGEIPMEYQPFDGLWRCQKDEHCWLLFKPVYLDVKKGQKLFLEVDTNKNDGWDANNPQMLLFYDGKTARGADINHKRFAFPTGVNTVSVYVYSGVDPINLLFITAKYLVRDERVHALQSKFDTLYEILTFTGAETKNRADISEILRRASNAIDFATPYSKEFYDSIEVAEKILEEARDDTKNKPTVWSVGHTHIDIAWLWTKAQTREKVLRSFSTALALSDEYPEYRFMSSQPILYEYVKEQDPLLYNRIKGKVREGRWETEGAMWVEADCNLTSGESLVRQIMVGKKFFKDEFSKDSKILWLPDVFGYSASMPQILKKSGVKVFVTSKISWNETDRMPHEIFKWQGIDGTEIQTYFMTTQRKVKDNPSFEFITYNGEGNPAEVEGTYFRLSDKNLTNDVLMPYGHGDGGGGTTPKMIECIDYLSKGVKGCCKTKFATSAEFFDKLKENLADKQEPRWIGELYLEFHRGTYTSIAKNKRNNRKAEFAMWRTEWISSIAKSKCGKTYPKAELDKNLKTILTNQFHDILPGSSIKEVYDKTDEEYKEVFDDLSALENMAIDSITNEISEKGIVVFNPNSYEGESTVVVDGVTAGVNGIPAKGYAVVRNIQTTNNISACENELENKFFRLKFDTDGNIVSLFDKRAERECVKEGGVCNKIIAYENLPYEFDNWELKRYYAEKPITGMKLIGVTVVNDGVRRGLKIERAFLSSKIEQIVWLYENMPRIDFDTEIDWHEHHIVLRSESDTSIQSDFATYEIQYGAVKRASNDNTSWDAAKFETCAHKYIDVSEYGYGISLLNDCKYGHSVRNGKIGLTLLTCGTYPDPEADQGKHKFTYSLMPHGGDYRTADVIGQAYLLNNPLIAKKTDGKGTLPATYSFINCDNRAIVIETVKESEDGKGLVIRAYESFGSRVTCAFVAGFAIGNIYETDLLENKQTRIEHGTNDFSCEFKPYEIKTYYIETANGNE